MIDHIRTYFKEKISADQIHGDIRHEYLSKYRQSITGFLDQLPQNYSDFNISDIPTSLWQHVFVLDVHPDGELVVRLTGTAIEEGVGRGCHGLVFSKIVHGPRSDDVLQAFMACAKNSWSGMMCQAVKISSPERVLSITAGIKKLSYKKDKSDIIVGLMFVDYTTYQKYDVMGFSSEDMSQTERSAR